MSFASSQLSSGFETSFYLQLLYLSQVCYGSFQFYLGALFLIQVHHHTQIVFMLCLSPSTRQRTLPNTMNTSGSISHRAK